jgi:hypothetical protein
MDSTKNDRVKATMNRLDSQRALNYAAAARDHHINPTTLTRRYNDKTVSQAKANSTYRQRLNDVCSDSSGWGSRNKPTEVQGARSLVTRARGRYGMHRRFETLLMRAQSGSGELRAEGTWLSKLKGRNIVEYDPLNPLFFCHLKKNLSFHPDFLMW